jgi:hypothetical protein
MATEPFDPIVDFYVLVQISSLSETKAAIGYRTYVRSLVGVNSQMIKEIVPFSKPLVAVFMVTF